MRLSQRILVGAVAASMAFMPNLVMAQQQRQDDGRSAGTGAARVTRGTFGGLGLSKGELLAFALLLGAAGGVAIIVAGGSSSSGTNTGQ